MTGTATAFASLPELLRCVAEYIHTTRQLATLCLVNKTFNTAITPVLYRNLEVTDRTLPVLKGLLENGRLAHVKVFTVSLNKTLSHQETLDTFMPLLGHLGQVECLKQVTALNAVIRQFHNLLNAFREQCPRIQELDITFSENMSRFLGYSDLVQPEEHRAFYAKPDLASFSGLKSLALRNLYQELDWWRDQIVSVLRASPDLQHLELSLALWTLHLHHVKNEDQKFANWFDELCEAYAATGAKPLRLRSLHLGCAVLPFNAEAVQKLVDLRHLEDLYIHNEGIYYDGKIVLDMYNYDDEDSGIAFDAFGSENCPNLRRFSMVTHHRDVHNMLAQADPAWLRNLAVSCHGTWGGWEFASLLRPDPEERHPQLPVHLRMLHIELQREMVFLRNYDGEHMADEDIPALEQVLDNLVTGDDGALEGLGVHLEVRCGQDGGPVEPGEHPFEDFHLFLDAIGKLSSLTQLAVLDYKSMFSEKRILKEWEAEHAACMLAMANPRLRYVRVHRRYWRIWREDGNVRLEKLAELDDETVDVDRSKLGEASQVELFRWMNWKPETL
ncbi:hypothetical protein VTJ49DRAFT_927 [Mycothermus thermophilus]|uniref:F-box domain-containing protein n=1 Tax=Humicola insolens TaxID=85995 RepID=A0ABR3VEG9_HUMIN